MPLRPRVSKHTENIYVYGSFSMFLYKLYVIEIMQNLLFICLHSATANSYPADIVCDSVA